jgi:hypothetical protein
MLDECPLKIMEINAFLHDSGVDGGNCSSAATQNFENFSCQHD